jgi:hypothetical protein
VKSGYALATATDDMGRCANVVSKLVLGGCFVVAMQIYQQMMWSRFEMFWLIGLHYDAYLFNG